MENCTSSTRRRFLQIASSLLAVPFASFGGREAGAAAKPPLRLLTVIDSYGLPAVARSEAWLGSSVGDYALAGEPLGTVLSPLSAYRDNMLVVSGLSMDSLRLSRDAATHDKVTGHALTGSSGPFVGAAMTRPHASLDVRVGQFLSEEYGLASPRVYPHISLSDYAEPATTAFSFDAGGSQIRAIAGPRNAALTLFGAAASDPVAETLDYQSHQLALGLVRERVQSIRGELVNANASGVLDAYRSSVEQLATELELRSDSVCVSPDVNQIRADGKFVEAWEFVPHSFDNVFQALACDLVSSLTYSIGGETINQLRHRFLYDAAEHADASLLGLLTKNFHAASHVTTPVAEKVHELVRTYQSEQLAGLLDKLSTTPDVDGSTILDNTVVFVTSAMSNNTHKVDDYGHLVIAGQNSGLKGGFHYDGSGSTNNDLLTTLARGLGLPDESFGGYDKSGALMAGINNGPIGKMLKG